MAEGQDQDDKTQDATERRLEKAADDGNVPRSAELTGFLTLGAGTAATALALMMTARPAVETLGGMLAHAGEPLAGRDGALMRAALSSLGIATTGPFLAVMLAAVAGNLMLHAPRLVTKNLMPKAERVSPMAGAKRLFGLDNLVHFIKVALKTALAAGAMLLVLWPDGAKLMLLASLADIRSALPVAGAMLAKLVGIVLALYAVIAGLDAFYQRFSWKKKLRMSHHEVKEEHKETEGNPEVKARLRQIRNQMMRRRMMAAVPKATVIITNPTHYAVALQFEKGMPAPVLLAKGVDDVALKIREIAGEHRIPIVENPPLARALHATVDIDEAIPAEHYKAVAEVIGYVFRLNAARRR